MRVVLQRVAQAEVEIAKKIVGSISQGLVVLIGITEEDAHEDLTWMCNKILGMRIFSDEDGKMNLSVKDVDGEILAVSQFTLYASTKKGNRPSFLKAARPERARALYEEFLKILEQTSGKIIETGKFGEMMQVRLVNDGPVTIIVDSKNQE